MIPEDGNFFFYNSEIYDAMYDYCRILDLSTNLEFDKIVELKSTQAEIQKMIISALESGSSRNFIIYGFIWSVRKTTVRYVIEKLKRE